MVLKNDKEKMILKLKSQSLTDRKIASKLQVSASHVCRARHNTQKKLHKAILDIEWAQKTSIKIPQETALSNNSYSFYL